jgi:hypothetical protein
MYGPRKKKDAESYFFSRIEIQSSSFPLTLAQLQQAAQAGGIGLHALRPCAPLHWSRPHVPMLSCPVVLTDSGPESLFQKPLVWSDRMLETGTAPSSSTDPRKGEPGHPPPPQNWCYAPCTGQFLKHSIRQSQTDFEAKQLKLSQTPKDIAMAGPLLESKHRRELVPAARWLASDEVAVTSLGCRGELGSFTWHFCPRREAMSKSKRVLLRRTSLKWIRSVRLQLWQGNKGCISRPSTKSASAARIMVQSQRKKAHAFRPTNCPTT